MGQYYRIINIDKAQRLEPFDYDNGMKLTEWSYDRNIMVLAMMNLMADEWKGDRVYVVGDYADTGDMAEVWAETYRAAVEELGSSESLYNAAETFERIVPPGGPRFKPTFEYEAPESETISDCYDHGIRYIYNHDTKQYVDLKMCPVEWEWEHEGERGVTKFAPLPLLLAMGNGRGGGDYWSKNNMHLVGSWCATVRTIDLETDMLPNCESYELFTPNFTENESNYFYSTAD